MRGGITLSHITIAVDGPSSSGKGTISKLLAQACNFIYLDTGAMYRALTYYCVTQEIDLQDEAMIIQALQTINIEFDADNQVFIDGVNVSLEIRTNEISKLTSQIISQYAEVRKIMVQKQRQYAEQSSIIVDGRDIGTVAFPNADYKFFISASLPERARRRNLQNKQQGSSETLQETEQALAQRDYNDITRTNSPLLLATDSKVIDTTNDSVEQTLQKLTGYLSERTGDKI